MVLGNEIKLHTATSAPLHSCEVTALRRNSGVCRCQIEPAWDGSGDYVLWAWPSPARNREPGRGRRLLVHEDGAALRFPNPVKAHAHAVKCGFCPDEISIRWPPEPPIATPLDG